MAKLTYLSPELHLPAPPDWTHAEPPAVSLELDANELEAVRFALEMQEWTKRFADTYQERTNGRTLSPGSLLAAGARVHMMINEEQES